MKRKNRIGFILVLTALIVLSMSMPAHAWSDIGVEYCEEVEPGTYGEWSMNDNTALESYRMIWSYELELVFIIDNIDQTADVYKIRIDCDGGDGDPPEDLMLYYRWGDSGTYTWCRYFGTTEEDFYYTITDASDTELNIKIKDSVYAFDFYRDQWDFGGEPELWMYWY